MCKSESINMFWCKLPEGRKNFGDDLGPYLVSKLTGKSIIYIPIVNSYIKILLLFLKGIFEKKYKLSDFRDILRGIKSERVLVTIGSIISSFNSLKADVWGTGLMFKNAKINNANFYAVRGKYTQARLKELGFKVPNAIGDPALLLPIILQPSKKKFKLGIIPHYIHFDELIEKLGNEKEILIINLLDDIEKVVEDITSCEYTISSSLHGLIVSHAYDIRSLWYGLSDDKLAGDNVKFFDYFSSVGINEYRPFYFDLFDLKNIIINIENNSDKNKIKYDLLSIQKELLNAAPFDLLNEFRPI